MMRCVVSKEIRALYPPLFGAGAAGAAAGAVLLFGRAFELQSAPFDLDDHRLDFGLEGFPELLQGVGVHLHFRALVEAALDCIRAAKNRAGGRSLPGICVRL
jgi:hypothetical protein